MTDIIDLYRYTMNWMVRQKPNVREKYDWLALLLAKFNVEGIQ